MPRILLLTTEPLPVAALPTTGAGLRAWGLTQGLRAHGMNVRVLMPRDAVATYAGDNLEALTGNLPEWVGLFNRAELRGVVAAENPDVLILQHWGMAHELGEVICPFVIDLAGPHLLERKLWGSTDPEGDLREKLDALRRADFVTCSGRFQRLYFLPYLALAGWDVTPADTVPVIPFCHPPVEPPARINPHRLIYGGFFLPWQDPARALRCAMRVLGELPVDAPGELLFIGGAHPSLDVARGSFESLLRELEAHPRVRIAPPMSYADYINLLAEGGVALDLMARNAERELAFTTRTVVYLAVGLPVIHNNYSELAEIITDAGAGWALDPEDEAGLEALLGRILRGEEQLEAKAKAARALTAQQLHWDLTIEPLLKFCRRPGYRENKLATRLSFEEQGARLAQAQNELQQARSQLSTLQGKRWVRWGLGLLTLRGLTKLPMTIFAGLVGLLLWPVFAIADARTRARSATAQE